MSKELGNFQIDDFFKEEENEDLKNNYVGTYSIDSITKCINFYEIIKRRNAKYPFEIFNTDKENQPGVHWWSFMNINPKNNLFLFDSFVIEGFKLCIVDNDLDIINELLYDFKKCESKSNKKLELCPIKFCVETWQKMSHKRKDQLTDTAQNFFHLLEQFAKLKKTHCMNILILEKQVQDLTRSTCGHFQLYFYKNLFDPDKKCKTISHRTLNKSTLQARMNKVFSTDIKENEYILKNFKEEYNL